MKDWEIGDLLLIDIGGDGWEIEPHHSVGVTKIDSGMRRFIYSTGVFSGIINRSARIKDINESDLKQLIEDWQPPSRLDNCGIDDDELPTDFIAESAILEIEKVRQYNNAYFEYYKNCIDTWPNRIVYHARWHDSIFK